MSPRVAQATVMLAMAAIASGCAMLEDSDHAQQYAGLEAREIKALSPEQTDDLLAGAGMSMALAAELNGWPGPLHVLEFADDLDLSDAQREEVSLLYASMKTEAQALGRKVIDKEKSLDELFAEGEPDEESLQEAVREIARLRGDLRAVHLKYHLRTAPLLSPAQNEMYQQLRGYGHHHDHHH